MGVEAGILDRQRAADQLQGQRILRPAILAGDAAVVFPRHAAERGAAVGAAHFEFWLAGLAGEVEAHEGRIEVGGGHQHGAVGAIGIGGRGNPAVAVGTNQHRGQHAARPVPGVAVLQPIPARQFPGERAGQFQPAQDPRAGVEQAVGLEALDDPAEETHPLVREVRTEIGRRQHQQASYRVAGRGEATGHPVPHHQRAGAVHDHVHRARRQRQAGVAPRQLHRLGDVLEADVVVHADVVAEIDRHDVLQPELAELRRQRLEGIGMVAPSMQQHDHRVLPGRRACASTACIPCIR